MQKSLAKNSIYNIIYTVANILFPFVTSIYVSRILLPVGVGKVASAQNIASYFVTLAALGLPSYGVREFAKVRDNKAERDKLFTELLLLNIISTTLAVVGFFVLVFINAGFNGEWALYGACGLAIFFNYLNIDWMYKGLEEYGYITGRSLAIKGISLLALFLFVKTRQDYVAYALISSLATGGNYVFNVIHDCCGDYAYDAAEGKGDVIKEEYFENCEWHIRALFEGERKMEDNQAKCEGAGRSNVCVSYHALSEDWSEIADRTINMLEKIIENEAVHAMLAVLTDKQRDLIHQQFVLGKTHQEIADDMGISRGSVTRAVNQALERIRRKFDFEAHYELAAGGLT